MATGNNRIVFDGTDWTTHLDSILNKKREPKPSQTEKEVEKLIDDILSGIGAGLGVQPSKAQAVKDVPGVVRTEFLTYKVIKRDNRVTVRVVLPGADKNALSASLTDNLLAISYNVRDLETNELTGDKTLKIELPAGEYSQAGSDIRATYANGILTVELVQLVPQSRSVAITFQ